MMHVALSVSRQQSRRWAQGLTIQREFTTSSTVTRCFINAFGLLLAWLLWATLTRARSSLVTPYSIMCRVKENAKLWTALARPYGRVMRPGPLTGVDARDPVPPIRTWE